ncbi:MAG: hypothetical protein R3E95_18165 [Thiolinea sp.]
MPKTANNNTLSDVDIQFSVDNNATIEPDQAMVVLQSQILPVIPVPVVAMHFKTAKLTPGLNNPENRSLVVTVTAGNQVRTLDIEVVGTNVQLDGPARIVINTPTRFVAKLKDSSGTGLPYQVVTLASTNGSSLEAATDFGFSTNLDGEVSFDVTAASSGNDVITASAL